MEDIIAKVIAAIDSNMPDPGSKLELPGSPIPFSRDNFCILPADPCPAILFIDGGSAEIIGAAHLSVQLIRTYSCRYEGRSYTDRKREEDLVVITARKKGSTMEYTAQGTSQLMSLSVDSMDEALRTGTSRASISSVGNMIRRMAEIQTALRAVPELPALSLIVLDGSLDPTYPGEEPLLLELARSARARNIAVVGLSKTSDLLTDTGYAAASALASLQPDGCWVYHPLLADPGIHDICFVKLHESSEHVFRMDFFGKKEDALRAASALHTHSADPVFLGYPYGLVESDRFARVSHQETSQIKTRLMAAAGTSWGKIQGYLRTKDSHALLDSIG